MSVNYNISLLRAIAQPLDKSFHDISTRLLDGEYRRNPHAQKHDHQKNDQKTTSESVKTSTLDVEAEVAASDLSANASVDSKNIDPHLSEPDKKSEKENLPNIAHQIHSNLTMVLCHSVTRVAATLSEAVKGLFESERRGWNAGRSLQIAQLASRLSLALARHVHHMVEGDSVLPVTLWPLWSSLNEAMGLPRGAPEDLFEPNPQFGDNTFQGLDADYLKEVVDGACTRLVDLVKSWENETDFDAAERIARRVLEIFDGLYSLKHRRSYQLYWLTWRARLTLGLMEGSSSIVKKRHEWVQEMQAVLVELSKFGKGSRAPIHNRVMSALEPIINKAWPENWAAGHPILAELDNCLGLTAFWEMVDIVQNPEQQKASIDFEQHRQSLLNAVVDLRNACTRAFDNPTPQTLKALVQTGMGVMGKQEWVPSPEVMPLFDAIQRLVAHVSSQGKGPPNPEVALESASMILLLEETLERPFPLSSEVLTRIKEHVVRLEAAWEGRLGSLRNLPVVRWDEAYRDQQGRHAVLAALKVAGSDLAEIESGWLDAERGEADAPDEIVTLAKKRLSLLRGVFMMLCRPAGSEMAVGLMGCLTSPRFARITPESRHRFIQGLTAISAYLDAVCLEQVDASNALSGCVEWVGDALSQAISWEMGHDEIKGGLGLEKESQDVLLKTQKPIPSEPVSSELASNEPVADKSDSKSASVTLSALDDWDDEAEGEAEQNVQADEGDGITSSVSNAEQPEASESEYQDPSSIQDTAQAAARINDEESREDVDLAESFQDSDFAQEHQEEMEGSSWENGDSEAQNEDPDLDSRALENEALASNEAVSSPSIAQNDLQESSIRPEARPEWLKTPLPPLPGNPAALRRALSNEGVVDRPSDREIALCFVDETFDVLSQMKEDRETLLSDPNDMEALSGLRRGYHTLKGSGRMAGYVGLAEIAWMAERALEERLSTAAPFDTDADNLLSELEEDIHGWALQLRSYGKAFIKAPRWESDLLQLIPGVSDEESLLESFSALSASDENSDDLSEASNTASDSIEGQKSDIQAVDDDVDGDDEDEAWNAVFDALENLVHYAQVLGESLSRVRSLGDSE